MDEVQFDPDIHYDEFKKLRGLFGTIEGFYIKKVRRPRKNIPEWVMDDHTLRYRILFPALRRYRIAYLYWHMGLSAIEVAEEVGITVGAVQAVIHKLTRLTVE